MVGFFLLRIALVLLAGALAGGAAYAVVSGQPVTYERTLTFVVRPSPSLTDAQIPDAVRGLSQQDAQLVNTIGGAIGSDRFLQEAVAGADLADTAAIHTARSSVRPGSDIVEVHLRGPEPADLGAIGDEYRGLASDWVATAYGAYVLEFLEQEGGETPVAPRTAQTTGLATMLGLLLAAGIVFAEWKARGRRRRLEEPAASGRTQPREPPIRVEDATGRVDRIEAALRPYLDAGEVVVRESPERLRIIPAPAPPGVRAPGQTQT